MKPSEHAIEDWTRTVSVKPTRSLTNEEAEGLLGTTDDCPEYYKCGEE